SELYYVYIKSNIVIMTSIKKENYHLLVTTCLGKSFNLASLPHSYFITKDRKIIKNINDAMGGRYNVNTASSLALAAIEAAYLEYGESLAQLNEHIKSTFQ